MFKYLLLLISIPITLYATENIIKAVAKQNNDIIKVKALLKSPMRGEQDGDKPIDYLTHIVAMHDKNIVFDLTTSPYYAGKSKFTFRYKKPNNVDTLSFLITDYKNKTSTLDVKIKNITPKKISSVHTSNKLLPINFNTKIWNNRSCHSNCNVHSYCKYIKCSVHKNKMEYINSVCTINF